MTSTASLRPGAICTVDWDRLAAGGIAAEWGRLSGLDACVVLATTDDQRVKVRTATGVEIIIPRQAITEVRPAARSTDPATSRAAARRTTANDGQRAALAALAAAGPAGLNDFELAARTGRKPTSIGVRRKELLRAGLVASTGQRRPSDTGSPAMVWAITDIGLTEWERQRAEDGAA